jgi:histidine triad (HIT) family protein
MKNCIFCKIRDRIIVKEFAYEDEEVMVFPDINPIKPVHLLFIPKKHIEDFSDIKDDKLWGKIRIVLQKMIKKENLGNKGYRIAINGGGAQIIKHLHIHLVGPLGKEIQVKF